MRFFGDGAQNASCPRECTPRGTADSAALPHRGANVMTENRNGFVVEAELRQASGHGRARDREGHGERTGRARASDSMLLSTTCANTIRLRLRPQVAPGS